MDELITQNNHSITNHINKGNEDDKLIKLWLHGKSKHTVRSYQSDIQRLRTYINLPFVKMQLGDLQDFADSLTHLAKSTQARIIFSVKSLFTFGCRIGMLSVNIAGPLKVPAVKNALAERILSLGDVHRMFAMEDNYRNQVLLKFLYVTGVRVSELVSLKWKDIQPREEGGQVTIFGKGGKTRVILIPPLLWKELILLWGNDNDPVFQSRKEKGHLDPSQVHRIVKSAAKKADLSVSPSVHWLRHAHASHALDQKAPIHLVQATLGHANVATTGRYLHVRPNESSSTYLTL